MCLIMKIRPDTRTAIIEAAFTVFGANPGAGLADVARHAGVGRATLHRHFKGRDDLMAALAGIALQEIDDAVRIATKGASTHTEGLRLTLAAIIPLGNRQGFLAHERIVAPDLTAQEARQNEAMIHAINAAKDEGTFAADVPTDWVAATFDNLIYTAWLQVKAQNLTPDQAAALAWRTLTSGLSHPHTQEATS